MSLINELNCPRCNEISLSLGNHPRYGEIFCCPKCKLIDSNNGDGQLIWNFQSSRLWENEESTDKPEKVKVMLDRAVLWR